MTIRELILAVDLEFNQEHLQLVDDIVGDIKNKFASLIKVVGAVGVALTGFITILARGALKTAELSEEIERNAAAFGTTAEEYQKFEFAFSALGASTDDMVDALATATDRTIDALEGSKNYRKELERLNVEVDTLKGKKPAEIFKAIIKGASTVTDESQKMTAVVRLFGDDLGRRIAPALVSGANSFQRFFEAAEATGIIMDAALVKQGRDAQFAFRLLGATVRGLWRTLTVQLAPAISVVSEEMFEWFRINGRVIRSSINLFAKRLVQDVTKLVEGFKRLSDIVGGFRGFVRIFKVLGATAGVFLTILVGSKIATLAKSVKALGLAFKFFVGASTFKAAAAAAGVLTAKILTVAAVFGSVFLILEDIYVFLIGGDSVIGRLLEQFANSDGMMGVFVRSARAVIVNALELATTLGSVGDEIVLLLNEMGFGFETFGDVLLALTTGILTVFANVYRGIFFYVKKIIQVSRLAATAVRTVLAALKGSEEPIDLEGRVRDVFSLQDTESQNTLGNTPLISENAKKLLGLGDLNAPSTLLPPPPGSNSSSSKTVSNTISEGAIQITVDGDTAPEKIKTVLQDILGEFARSTNAATAGAEQ